MVASAHPDDAARYALHRQVLRPTLRIEPRIRLVVVEWATSAGVQPVLLQLRVQRPH
jgi:hypothetical protein